MGCIESKNVLETAHPVFRKPSCGSLSIAQLGRSCMTTTSLSLPHHHRRADNSNNNKNKVKSVVDNSKYCYHVVILKSSSYGLLTMEHQQQQRYNQHDPAEKQTLENEDGIPVQIPDQAGATVVTDERMYNEKLVKNSDVVPVDLVSPKPLLPEMSVGLAKKKKKKQPPLVAVAASVSSDGAKLLFVSEEEVEPAESINLLELMDGLEEDMSERSTAAVAFEERESSSNTEVSGSPDFNKSASGNTAVDEGFKVTANPPPSLDHDAAVAGRGHSSSPTLAQVRPGFGSHECVDQAGDQSSPAELLQMILECEEKKPSDKIHQGTKPFASPAAGSTKLKPSPYCNSSRKIATIGHEDNNSPAPYKSAGPRQASNTGTASIRGMSKPPRYPVKPVPPKVPASSQDLSTFEEYMHALFEERPLESIATRKPGKSTPTSTCVKASSIGEETNRQSCARDKLWTEELPESTMNESDLLESFVRELEQFLNDDDDDEWHKLGKNDDHGAENSAKRHSEALPLQLPADTTTTKRNKIIERGTSMKLEAAGRKKQIAVESFKKASEPTTAMKPEETVSQSCVMEANCPAAQGENSVTSTNAIAQEITKIFQDCTHVKFILQNMGMSIDELATFVEETGSPSQKSPIEACDDRGCVGAGGGRRIPAHPTAPLPLR